MNKSNIDDSRTRFIFNDLPIRGVYVGLSETIQHIISLKTYPKNIQYLLVELLAASVLLSSTIKLKGQLTLQIQGQGTLKLLVAESTSYNTCRATAEFSQITDENSSLQEMLGKNGIFVVTIQPENGEMWQGIVPLEKNTIADMLTDYMRQSEQLDTIFQFSVAENGIRALLLQKLPGSNTEKNIEAWNTVKILLNTLTTEELYNLALSDILLRLFNEFDITLYNSKPIEFMCQCSQDKSLKMLLLLGEYEVKNILEEQGSVQFSCGYCGKNYVYDPEDINQAFGFNILEENRH